MLQLKLLAAVNKTQFNPVNIQCGTHHTPTHITQSIKLGYHSVETGESEMVVKNTNRIESNNDQWWITFRIWYYGCNGKFSPICANYPSRDFGIPHPSQLADGMPKAKPFSTEKSRVNTNNNHWLITFIRREQMKSDTKIVFFLIKKYWIYS